MPRAEQWVYQIIYAGPVWLRDLFRRKKSEEELDEELSFHLERQMHEDIAHGVDPSEALERAARLQRGIEHARQECRDVRRITPIEDLIKDALHAARNPAQSSHFRNHRGDHHRPGHRTEHGDFQRHPRGAAALLAVSGCGQAGDGSARHAQARRARLPDLRSGFFGCS